MNYLLAFICLPLIIEVLRRKRFTFFHVLAMACMTALLMGGRVELAAFWFVTLTVFSLVR